jgi:hypothetical protein
MTNRSIPMRDADVAQPVLDPGAHGTADVGDDVWREPGAVSRPQARPDRETGVVPHGDDKVNVVETFGRASRESFSFQRIPKLGSATPAERNVKGVVAYVHPLRNALVTVLSGRTHPGLLEPLGLGRTRSIDSTLTNGGADAAHSLAAGKRGAEFLGRTGAAEDRAVVAAIERRSRNGANDVFTSGRFESASVHLSETLDAVLT